MQYFILAFALSLVATYAVKKFAERAGIVDRPDEKVKKHKKAVPLLGGLAIFLSFWLVVAYLAFFTNLFGANLQPQKLIMVFIASVPLMIIGYFDDKHKLPAVWRLGLSAVCVLLLVLGGLGLNKITNPFGGVLYLDFWQINLGFLGYFSLVSGSLVFLWIIGMMYTTKILDGLDGLSTGIASIASFMIFFIANGERWHQPDVALLSLVFAGACLGFLVFNFYPAKIFLGEGGSLFVGFMLGVLSVISGGKIATALLVMAVPILDLARVVFVRARKGQSIFKGDREHMHFRLLDLGFSHRQTVLLYYTIAFIFGITTLFFQSIQKLFALAVLLALMCLFGFWLGKKE
ncbi:undecaprenyl/decaprenyl-phosphate alpha-N-acetylglucosaminyl 1-phosphate transferase [Patescibacteria group bacterium]|nr:undecaprenyl/decaprenyl-phosphate alpha-N-acetylglucosaminyl 1-phosphate transferase [Patescibacteria group bacterium]MBU1613128.1 undecaprenyl/decaprenyl-phosphate alpha-N-acetylglucosaminyl 1-phosphate transferase [Patescibacteria group bacterium]